MKAELIKEINNEIANVKWFKIPATKTAIINGYNNCIEKHYLYKETGIITITRHMSETIEQICEQEDTYYQFYNGRRISCAKR